MLTRIVKRLTTTHIAPLAAANTITRNLSTATNTPSIIDDVAPLKPRNRIARDVYSDMAIFLCFAENCEDITRRIKDCDGYLDDILLAKAYNLIRTRDVETDQHFFNGLVPLTTKYIRKFNSGNARAFAEIVRSAGALGVEDKDFWRAVKECLAINRMYRYMPLDYIGDVIKGFAIVGQADETVLQLLGDQVIKHKKFIAEETKTTAKQGFQIAEIGFNEFKRALEDDEVYELQIKK